MTASTIYGDHYKLMKSTGCLETYDNNHQEHVGRHCRACLLQHNWMESDSLE